MNNAPIIGILLDHQPEGSFSTYPHYALREHYFNAIEQAGGVPIGISYQALDKALNLIDGLLLPGGDYQTPAEHYVDGSTSPHPPSGRSETDAIVIQKALEKLLPLFAICAGEQTLACALGGKLHGDVSDYLNSTVPHTGIKKEETAHDIYIEKNTLLHRILGADKIPVNSAHKEVVATLSDALICSAKAEDGAIEAIEIKGHPFALAVQWHPEHTFKTDPYSAKLFKAFVDFCKKTA